MGSTVPLAFNGIPVSAAPTLQLCWHVATCYNECISAVGGTAVATQLEGSSPHPISACANKVPPYNLDGSVHSAGLHGTIACSSSLGSSETSIPVVFLAFSKPQVHVGKLSIYAHQGGRLCLLLVLAMLPAAALVPSAVGANCYHSSSLNSP